jgi:hypothetical protein
MICAQSQELPALEGEGTLLIMPDVLKHLGSLNENYIWASCIWGAVASGYLIYGWRQHATIPFLGGVAMTAASFFITSALLMSLACIALMYAVWWLLKQGY